MQLGQTISHYRVLSKLGEGGMGIVYQAEDVKLKRTVALKFLPPHATENRERFLREAQAAASLNHPNICIIHEIDEEHGFIAMEFIEGPSVKEKIEARPLPLEEALHIAIQACTGLQAAHSKGIVHRDIKPANLMLTAEGQLKIMDFGLAQVGSRTRITKTGASVGTPAYMSPEQTQGQAADRRTDIWSLGVVLFEMLTGRLPFAGETDQAVSYGIVHTEPEPVTALRSGLPVELDRIVAKALAKSPEDRYQSAADLIVDLRGAGASRQTSNRQPVHRPNRRLWAGLSVAALVVAAAGFFTWRAFAPERRTNINPQALEFYDKALYHLSNRMRPGEVPVAIELLKRAVEIDPNYALARAQLGYAYAVHSIFYTDDPAMIELATKELTEAEKLDPGIAQVHIARSVLLFSRHGGWNLREAILEARAGQRLDPNAGHHDLAYYYDHLGLEALAAKHRLAALRLEPDNEYHKQALASHYYGFMRPDEAAAAEQKLLRRSPRLDYYLIKGMANEAAPLVEKENAGINPAGPMTSRQMMPRVRRAHLYALRGNFAAAGTEIAAVELQAEKVLRTVTFHHTSYGIAQVRARMGDTARALRWLQITADSGWPNYPMMSRDRMLDPVRNDPAVAKFLASLRKTWEDNQREFGTPGQ